LNSGNCYKSFLIKKYKLFTNVENLNCNFNQNWQQWNEEHCKNISHEQEEEMNFPTKSTQSIVSSQFFFVWHSTPSTTINRGLNSTTKMLKYDMTTAFYWVTSFCVAVVTISCLFIIWFYCFKRFRFSRQLGLLSQQNRNNQLRNRQLNRHDLSRFSQRRSIYLVNPRLNNQPHNLNPNEILTPNMLVRIYVIFIIISK
jgi:flagellar biosynthesis/type III secretory pathway M-ring protein FliF/YscJ